MVVSSMDGCGHITQTHYTTLTYLSTITTYLYQYHYLLIRVLYPGSSQIPVYPGKYSRIRLQDTVYGGYRVFLHRRVTSRIQWGRKYRYTQQQVCRCILCLIPITLYTYTTYMHLYPTPILQEWMESHTPVYQEGRVGYWYQQQGRLVPQDTMVPIGTYTLEVNTQGNYLYLPSLDTLQYLQIPTIPKYYPYTYSTTTGKGTSLVGDSSRGIDSFRGTVPGVQEVILLQMPVH